MIHSMLIASALRSLVMAAIVWSGMRLLRVSHVLAQKIAWTVVLCMAFALALPARYLPLGHTREVLLPVYRLLPPIAALPANPPIAHGSPSAMVHGAPSTSYPTEQPAGAVQAASQSASPALVHPTDWLRFGTVIYLAVCAILLCRLFLGLAIALRIWRRATPIAQEDLSLAGSATAVRSSPDLAAPVTIGSSILLPASYSEWTAEKLRIVLAHERSHIRQGDFYFQMLARLYTVIFWPSPLGWWLQRKLSDLGEAVSDRAALAEAENAPTYAELLIEFATVPRLPLVGVGMARKSNLHERIDRLLSDAHFRLAFLRARRHIGLAAALLILAIAAATTRVRIEAAEAPQLDTALLRIPPVESGIPAPAYVGAAPAAQTSQRKTSQEQPKDAYAVVDGKSITMSSGPLGEDFEKVHRARSDSYIWFRRNGNSFIIDDPGLVAQAHASFWQPEELGLAAGRLADAQRKLAEQQARMENLQVKVIVPNIDVKVPNIDVAAILANIQVNLKDLEQETAVLSDKDLKELQAKVAADLAQVQSKINAQTAVLSQSVAQKVAQAQAEMAQKQAELAQRQAELAKRQACISGTAPERIRCLLDEALREGKAKPAQ